MIATKTFLFLHLHKSGGTFVNRALMQHTHGAQKIGYHLPYRYVPKDYSHLPVVTTIRNPWDFYVSFYFFQLQSKRPNYVYQVFSDNNTLTMHETLSNMAQPHENHFQALRNKAPDIFVNAGVNLTKQCIDELSEYTGGWYTRMFKRLYLGCDPHFMKMENLREELTQTVIKYGEMVSPNFEKHVALSRKKNTSSHEHYSKYYSDELRTTVHTSDKELIGRFNYSFKSLQPQGMV